MNAIRGRFGVPVLVGLALALAWPAQADARLTYFHTPSGRIYCMIVTGSDNYTRCEASFMRGAIFLYPTRRPNLVKGISDTVYEPTAPALAYGRTIRRGPFACTSRVAGLTCRARSGHGFFLAREKRRFFSATAARTPRVALATSMVAQGGVLTAIGRSWPARSRVSILIGPPGSEATAVGSVRTGASGRFTKRIRISLNATPGKYVLLACRRACAVKATAKFSITRRGAQP